MSVEVKVGTYFYAKYTLEVDSQEKRRVSKQDSLVMFICQKAVFFK